MKLLAPLAVFVLVGCGGTEEKSGQEEPTVEETTTEATTEETSERTSEETRERTTRESTTPEETATSIGGEDAAPVEIEVDPADGVPEISCDRFISAAGNPSQLQAQQFFDSNATPGQRAILDPEGDGFACSQGNPAQRSSIPPPPQQQVAAGFREAREKSSANEAGQDVSNIPVAPPDRSRLQCLQDYYRSQGSDAGRVSQQVTAQASAQGVSPYDVVGC